MSTYLVVAHQTAQSEELTRELLERRKADSASEFVLLVPVTRHEDLRSSQEGSLREIARRAARGAEAALKRNGINLKWSIISDYEPAVAIETEIKDHPEEYAGVILCTFPEGLSSWLKDHILSTLGGVGLPVTHVVAS